MLFQDTLRGLSTDFVFCAREEIRRAGRDGEAADGRDVARERDFELAGRQVPDLHGRPEVSLAILSYIKGSGTTRLDDPVACAGREPLVARLDGSRAHPAEVTGDDAGEFPLGMVVRLDLSGLASSDERLREESGLGVRDGDRGAVLRGRGEGLRAAEVFARVSPSAQISSTTVTHLSCSTVCAIGPAGQNHLRVSLARRGDARPPDVPSINFLCGPCAPAAAGPAGRAGPTPPFCCATRAAGRTLAFRYSASILLPRRTLVLCADRMRQFSPQKPLGRAARARRTCAKPASSRPR